MAQRPSKIISTVTLLAALTLTLGATTAQEPPVTPPVATEAKQDPQPPKQDPVKELQKQLESLQKELDHIKKLNESGGVMGLVTRRLGDRELNPTSIKDPSPPKTPFVAPASPGPEKKKVVRLFNEDEKEKYGADVVFTVDGAPVTQKEFYGLYDYFKTYMTTEDDEIKKEAVLQLIINKAALAAFGGKAGAAMKTIHEAKEQVDGGTDFAEVAKQMSQCPSAANGGDLGDFGRTGMDIVFAKTAFELQPGEVSEVVQTAFGYHLIKVTGKEAGENRGSDRVRASHILAMFDPDQMAVRKVMMDARGGNVELAFTNEDWKKFTPNGF